MRTAKRSISTNCSGKRRETERRGAAAVEFAVVLPLLMMLLLGGADFGRCFHSAMAITNAARAGAEYGAMHPFDAAAPTGWQAGVQQAAINELSNSPLFDTAKLTVVASSITEADGSRRVQVQVTYPFRTVFTWLYTPSSLTLQQTAVMRTIR
jgi:Flp pilus assembly protein TadG